MKGVKNSAKPGGVKNPHTPKTVGGPNKLRNYASDGVSNGDKQHPDAAKRGVVSGTVKNKK